METVESMLYSGIVPVFYSSDKETAKNVVRACYKGGIRVFEFTNRGDRAEEVFRSLVEMVTYECPELILGIGSIVDPQSCQRFINAGARFVVSPVSDAAVTENCRTNGIPHIPGCATPTEIFAACKAGAEMVKVFPAAQVGGPSFVKAVLAPMPWLKIMVTGGVEPTRENLSGWFAAGAACVGIGSNLFPPGAVEEGRWEDISRLCAEALSMVADIKNPPGELTRI